MQPIEPSNGLSKAINDFIAANPWTFYVIAGVIVLAIVWRTIRAKFGLNPNWYNSTKLDQLIELEKEDVAADKAK